MKLDRYSHATHHRDVKLVRSDLVDAAAPFGTRAFVLCCALCSMPTGVFAETPTTTAADQIQPAPVSQSTRASTDRSQPQALALVDKVLEMIVLGPAFDAKVRETVWTTGRKVVGVGTYEQAGGGSGHYNLQVIMHDGDGKHRLQQISDGRLAWTRSEVAGQVSLRRVDVGRLDEWVRGQTTASGITPGMRVGGWAEMLSQIRRDYVLRVRELPLKGEPVWVVSGDLRGQRRDEILAKSQRQEWPLLYPTRVMMAIQSKPDPETGFGQLLPVQIEFWSDPVATSANSEEKRSGRLITLIELYSVRPISPPPVERFRFENHNAEVIVNETDRYIQQYGVQLTERDRRQLQR